MQKFTLYSDFAIVGLKITNRTNINDLKDPHFKVLDHYSPVNQSLPDYLSNLNVMCFVSPIQIFSNQLIPIESKKQPVIDKSKRIQEARQKDYLHQFVLTDNLGKKRYCTSLVIYEKVNIHQIKSLSSAEQLQDSQRKILEPCYIPYAYCLVSDFSTLQSQKQIMMTFYKGILDTQNREKKKMMYVSLNDQSNINQEKFSTESSQIRIVESFEYFISLIFSIPKEFKSQKSTRLILQPIDKIQKIESDNDKLTFSEFPYLPSDIMFQLPDIDFLILFKRLSITNILKIIQCLFMEKQVMIFTDHVWELSSVCEALIYLIKPFVWRCPYIPYLPEQLLETFQATTPYIIGVHLDQKKSVLSSVDYSDKIMVTLNEDRVVGYISEFPEQIYSNLQNEVCKLGLKMDKVQEIKKDQIIQFRHILFKQYLQLINNFIPFFIYSEDSSNNYTICDIFQIDQYIQIFDSSDQIFYQDFFKTMVQSYFFEIQKVFSRLIEESYKILFKQEYEKNNEVDPESDADLLLFIDCIKRMSYKEVFNIQQHYQPLEVYFQERLKKIKLQEKFYEIECGEFYGLYKKTGQPLSFPISQINKQLIRTFPEAFFAIEKKTNDKPIQNLLKSSSIQKTQLRYISQTSQTLHHQINYNDYDEQKQVLQIKVLQICQVPVSESAKILSIKGNNQEIIFYPSKEKTKKMTFLTHQISNLTKIEAQCFKKENIGLKRWAQELKQNRQQEKQEKEMFEKQYPMQEFDLFNKLFDDNMMKSYTPKKSKINSQAIQYQSQRANGSSNKKIFSQEQGSGLKRLR